MTEDYVTFEQAKLLKEKGFPQDTCEKIEVAGYELGYPTNQLTEFAKPTLSLVAKWLREEKNICINVGHRSIGICDEQPEEYDFRLVDTYDGAFISDVYYFNTYEEALSDGIDAALKLI